VLRDVHTLRKHVCSGPDESKKDAFPDKWAKLHGPLIDVALGGLEVLDERKSQVMEFGCPGARSSSLIDERKTVVSRVRTKSTV